MHGTRRLWTHILDEHIVFCTVLSVFCCGSKSATLVHVRSEHGAGSPCARLSSGAKDGATRIDSMRVNKIYYVLVGDNCRSHNIGPGAATDHVHVPRACTLLSNE